MKQKLNLSERFALLGILPQEGNFATLKVVRKLREELSLTEEEIKHFGVKQITTNDGQSQINWNAEQASETKEIEFGEYADDLVKSKLNQLEADKKLTNEHFSLYEKFIEGKEDAK